MRSFSFLEFLSSTLFAMESTKLKNPGSSLPVPSVQQLAKEPILTVPSRYRRLDLDPPATGVNTELPLVPVIDMQKLLMAETADEELELLHSACKDWGFFQVCVEIVPDLLAILGGKMFKSIMIVTLIHFNGTKTNNNREKGRI